MLGDEDWYMEEWRKTATDLKNALPDFLQLLKVQHQAIKNKAPHETGEQRAERDQLLARYDRWISDTEALIGRFDDLEKKYQAHLHPDYSQINGLVGMRLAGRDDK